MTRRTSVSMLLVVLALFVLATPADARASPSTLHQERLVGEDARPAARPVTLGAETAPETSEGLGWTDMFPVEVHHALRRSHSRGMAPR